MKKMYKKILSLTMIVMLLVQLMPINMVQAASYVIEENDLPYSNKFVDLFSKQFSRTYGIEQVYVALDKDGNIWTWGSNASGIFGDGSEDGAYRKLPKKLEVGTKFKQISEGGYHFWVALDVNGNIWGCGNNIHSQLGNGFEFTGEYTEIKDTLFQITSGTKFTKIEAGNDCVLAIDESGNIWGWGLNESGNLMNEGKGNYTYSSSPDTYNIITRPLKLTTGKNYIDISTSNDGSNVAAAIDINNNLYVWGSNYYCQLGRNRGPLGEDTSFISSYDPIQIKPGTKFKKVSVGGRYIAALDMEGNLWRWGNISILGISTKTAENLDGYDSNAQAIYEPISSDVKYTDIYSGENVGYAKAASNQGPWISNEYLVWGNNVGGGFGSATDDSGNPTPSGTGSAWLNALNNYKIIREGLGIDENGYMWRWGFDYIDSETGSKVRAVEPIQITGESRQYTVTFKNGDEVIDTQNIVHGGAATAPTAPTKVGYTFAGWDKDFSNVTSDLTVNAKWTANTNTAYTIEHYKQNLTGTYDKVTGDTQHLTGTTGENKTATPKTYEGYHENQTHNDRIASGIIKADGSLVLKLYYDINQYTVTFISDGKTLSTQNIKHGQGAVAPEAPTKEGHTFAGWDKDFSNVTSDLTINANWNANTYNVTLNTNGGTIPEGQNVTSYTYGIGATLPTPTKQGYIFAGWYETENLTGEAINTIGTLATGDKEYFAKWEAGEGIVYKVEHYKQNITTNTYEKVATDELTGKTGESKTATPKTYEGYHENQTHNDRIASGIIKADGSLVLKLYYDINQYTVTFKNGDEVLSTQTIAHGQGAVAPEAPTKEGYTFAGWDKDISNVTSDLTVNANWTANTYEVTLNTNGGTIPEGQNVTSYIYGVGAALPTPTKIGYTFAGWYTNEELTGDVVVQINATDIGDKEYFAKWTANTDTAYTIEHYKQNLTGTYDKVIDDTQHLTGTTGENKTATPKTYEGYHENTEHQNRVATGEIAADGSLVLKLYYDINQYTVTFKNGDEVLSTQTIAHGQGAVTPEAPTKEGHTFAGWDKDFSNVTSDLTVNANWNANTYNVTLNANGGTIPEGQNVTSYTYGIGATLPTPTKVGYIFAGWYKTEDLTGEAIHTIGTLATGDKEYFAKWEAGEGIVYKVEHYKQNIATNTYEKVATDELTGKTGLNVVATPKTYEGYTENKTHQDRVATGEIAADGSLVLKLYYDVNQYTVTFKNGDEVISTQTIAHGQGAIAPETPTKEGYTFVGWDKDISNVTSDITVNAKWNANTYKVTLNTNGGTIPEGQNVTSYTYGIGATLPVPTKEGYTFAGWYKTEDLTGEAINTIGTLASGDKEYFAKWEAGEGTVYKVEHYKQNLATNTYEKVATDELTGKTGLNVVATPKTYEGYHENTEHQDRIATGEIAADGSLVLKLYYDVNQYTVTFKNGDEVLSTQTITHGEGAVVPEAPTKEGYTFAGWDKDFSNITSNLEINANWEKNQYKVIFKDGDKVVKEETVIHGENATPPVLTKPGYILSWDKQADNITEDTIFTAVWTKDPNDGKEEKPSFLPQTGENYIVIGTMSVLVAVAILVYLKYRKIGE